MRAFFHSRPPSCCSVLLFVWNFHSSFLLPFLALMSPFGFLCIVRPANASNVLCYLHKNGQSWLGQLSPCRIWHRLWCEPINIRSMWFTERRCHLKTALRRLINLLRPSPHCPCGGWFFTKDTSGVPDWPEQPRGARGSSCMQDYTMGCYQKLPSVTRSAL